jgi:16S rRNA (adenine1518-N6/adenine1519-N6)-dimethyltransferase
MTRARKRFGQHFLEPAWVAKVLRVIDPQPSDQFLEIGPGRGALTYPLSAAVAHVTAFEIDRDLARTLAEAGSHRLRQGYGESAGTLRAEAGRTRPTSVGRPENLTVVQGDFLDVNAETLLKAVGRRDGGISHPIRVAGNLPYNAASPILFKLVDLYRAGLQLGDATVMLQREVAERLLAKPGTGEYGVLTLLIGRHAGVVRLLDLPPGAFRPMPKVYSTVIRLTFHPAEPVAHDERTFEALTQAIFTRRRKTLVNALRAFPASERLPPADALARAGLDGTRRPETLSIEEIVRLADVFA